MKPLPPTIASAHPFTNRDQLEALTSELEDAGDKLAAAESTTIELRESRRRVDELEEEVEELKSMAEELQEKNRRVKEDFRHALRLAHDTQTQKDEVERELEKVKRSFGGKRRRRKYVDEEEEEEEEEEEVDDSDDDD